jgi:hypothetical protein
MDSPTVLLVNAFGSTVYIDEPEFDGDSCLGPILKGWWRYEGQLLPEDWGPHRMETCVSWEIL